MSDGAETLELALELMDKQLIDSAGEPCGKVEDIELEPSGTDEGPVVVAVVTSLGGLARRLDGWLGTTLYRVWRRLRREANPTPTRIPWRQVVKIDFALHLSVEREEADLDRSERWFRDHIVAKIPGAR